MSTEQQYYGTKRVTAWPQTKKRGPSRDAMVPTEGYAVRYDDGYEGWSPKEAFEAAYKPTTAMDFSGALAAMKAGAKVSRAGWERITLQIIGGMFRAVAPPERGFNTVDDFASYLSMNNVLADDWMIVP